MSKSANYSLDQVICTVDGLPLEGYAKGDDVISLEWEEDAVSKDVGADGWAVFSENLNKSGMVTIKLKHSSPFNQTFRSFLKQRKDFVFRLKELATGSEYFSKNTRVMNRPGRAFGTQAQEAVEWKLGCAALTRDDKGIVPGAVDEGL